MKIKINKLQYGGGFYTATVNPVAAKPSQQTATQQASGQSILSDKMLEKLTENGMPSDVEMFYKQMQQFQSNDFSLGVDKSSFYELQSLANRIIQNNKYMDEAVKRAETNGAIDDYAIDQTGFIYTADQKGQIKKIAFSDFDPSKNRALSINELIQYRRFSPDMAYDVDSVNTIGNSVGIDKINSYIIDIINKVGTASTKSQAFVELSSLLGKAAKEPSSAQKQALEGLSDVLNKQGLDLFVKVTTEQKTANMKEALSYIYQMLPRNMQAVLEGTYLASGNKKLSGTNYTYEIIKQALLTFTDQEYNQTFADPKSLNGSDESGGSSKSHRLSAIEVLLNGDVNRTNWVLAKGEDSTGITFHDATVISGIPTLGNHPAGTVPLRMALDAGMGSFLDYSQIYFGDQKVSSEALSKAIVGNNNSGVVYAPIDSKGNLDFSRRDAFEKAEKEIADNPNIYVTDQQKTLAHRNEGSPATYKNGKLSTEDGNVGKFFVTMVTTSDDIVDDANRFERKLKGDQQDQFKDMLEEIYSMDSVIKSGYKNPFNWLSNYYTVPVFIKVNEHAAYDASYYQGHGPLEQSVNSGYIQQQQLEQKTKPVYGSSQALFNYGK